MAPTRAGWPVRSRTDRVIAGVCGGVGARLGIDATIVRIAFVALAFAWIGVPLYLLGWVLLPQAATVPATTEADDTASAVRTAARRAAGMALIVLGTVLLVRHLGVALPDTLLWPALCVAFGLGIVVWRVQPAAGIGRAAAMRIAAGTILLALGIGAIAAANLSLSTVRDGLLSGGLVVGGLALILGPWMMVLLRDRREERRRRIRADERAEMAAHLHDSVLQTLSLVQRSDDPARMAALARRQERELRGWLYGGGSEPDAATVRAAVERLAGVVEDRHGVVMDVVAVGDAALDPAMESLVAAAGEAMTNAARWSGCATVSVFVEATEQAVDVFVRDRGVGFDTEEVEDGSHGIRDSIRGRLDRVGGRFEINSAPGQGTEVRLHLARS
ncbi:MAG: PspC domain-containing protein [Acidimicrobiaceae bacterium]|nr:PspC domain-containing protein [Acidimicrobiaceae bacterium]MXZ65783.1 PspC domain-containing protein [Acidimicrobiaceae bacterium]MYF32502.1 PspC domain-containing protein [Acidimicrobiaceae bacterium]MYG77167.1 PspC domain-containing protein [Acidimicrobiaceae bacterium]MYJ28788.1 PspC domain-containing protein [Acidimicrobiaceae bacterium]